MDWPSPPRPGRKPTNKSNTPTEKPKIPVKCARILRIFRWKCISTSRRKMRFVSKMCAVVNDTNANCVLLYCVVRCSFFLCDCRCNVEHWTPNTLNLDKYIRLYVCLVHSAYAVLLSLSLFHFVLLAVLFEWNALNAHKTPHTFACCECALGEPSSNSSNNNGMWEKHSSDEKSSEMYSHYQQINLNGEMQSIGIKPHRNLYKSCTDSHKRMRSIRNTNAIHSKIPTIALHQILWGESSQEKNVARGSEKCA